MWKFVCFCVLAVVTLPRPSDSKMYATSIECVHLTECQEYVDLIRRGPMTQDKIDFIKSTSCGFEGDTEKVWCTRVTEVPENSTEAIPVTEPAPRPSPVEFVDAEAEPDLSRARNILPDTSVCGQVTSNRIVGGTFTTIDEYPWTARLLYRFSATDEPEGRCGGTLISNRYVLTAAHCITKIGPPELVVLGEYNTNNSLSEEDCEFLETGHLDCTVPPQVRKIEKIFVHRAWPVEGGRSFYDDLALIRLAEPTEYTDFVQPICLPSKNTKLEENTVFVAAGWGKTEFGEPSEKKLQVSLPLYARSNCSRRLQRLIKEGQICAGGVRDKDTCTGDSGGPLMLLDKERSVWVVAGVVSIGNSKCGRQGVPAIYTYVPEHLRWIHSNIKP